MFKSLRITLASSAFSEEFLRGPLQEMARQLELEGAVQVLKPSGLIRVYVSGSKDNVDSFVDFVEHELHKGPENPCDIEPFMKVRTYRGVFRVVD